MLANIGVACRDQGRVDEARAHLEAALAIHREVGNRRDEGFVLGHLGLLHSTQGRWEDARLNLEAALCAHREVGNRRHEAAVIGGLADLQVRQGQIDEAMVMLGQGEAILRQVGDLMELANLLCIRGRAELMRGPSTRHSVHSMKRNHWPRRPARAPNPRCAARSSNCMRRSGDRCPFDRSSCRR